MLIKSENTHMPAACLFGEYTSTAVTAAESSAAQMIVRTHPRKIYSTDVRMVGS